MGHGHERDDEQPANIVRHVLVRHLNTFVERAEQADGLPRWVTDELRDYISCGDLSRGFARVRCDDCGGDHLVGFSCGGRGFCPRCGGRRMADTAAYLADQVLHDVPVRQWVLTVPWWLRARLHYDHELTGQVLRIFVRAVHAWLRRACGNRGQPGAVTVIQRFGSALRSHVHFHTLVPHGTYAERADATLQFLAAPVPTLADVETVAAAVATKVRALLDDRGLFDHYGHGELADDEPALRACVTAAANHQQLLGPQPGRPTERETTVFVSDQAPKEPPLAAQVDGFNLHAGVHIRANDPGGLERLCRYVARPPLAQKRMRLLEGDRVAIDLRHPWRDGTSAIILDPLDFIARLAALVPPPRCNLVRYHGALAPNAKLRKLIVLPAEPLLASARGHTRPKGKVSLRRRLQWAELMERVFGVDVLVCPECGGRRRLIALIEDPAVIHRILTHLGLPTAPPALHPPRPPRTPPSTTPPDGATSPPGHSRTDPTPPGGEGVRPRILWLFAAPCG